MTNRLSRRTFIASAAASVVAPAIAGSQPADSGLLSLFGGGPEPAATAQDAWRDAGIIDLSRSPYAKLKTVPVRAVTIQDGFWSKRRNTNLASSIPSMHDELVENGRMDHFLRLTGQSNAPQKGPVYSDSDIYKWTAAVVLPIWSGPLHRCPVTFIAPAPMAFMFISTITLRGTGASMTAMDSR